MTKEQVVRAEGNIDLFLNHHAYHVDMENGEITAVYAFDTRTSAHTKFVGRLYARLHRTRHDWFSGRGRLGDDGEGPHGHEQHVGLG